MTLSRNTVLENIKIEKNGQKHQILANRLAFVPSFSPIWMGYLICSDYY